MENTETPQSIEEIDAAIANLRRAKNALIAAEQMANKVTITFELLDEPQDGRAEMTWGDFRAMIARNTPNADWLELRAGLSETISLNTVWGTLKVEATK